MSEGKNLPSYLIVLGTTYSGSGAVYDYLSGRGDLYDPLKGTEYQLPQMPNGLMALEATANKSFHPATSDFVLDQFIKIIQKLDQPRTPWQYGKNYAKFAKFITDQNINLIFTVVGMFDQIRSWNKKNIKNYVEIYVKASISKIKKKRTKKIYLKNKKFIVGVSIKPQFPKKPNIVINNNFKKSIKVLSESLIKKIQTLKV